MKEEHISADVAERTVSLLVVEQIADLEGTDPMELPPLYDAIDPEALDSLVRSSSTDGQRTAAEIRFSYCGYDIRVGDGAIAIGENRRAE